MKTKRIHFPQTTAQQRKLLFETWEATGNVSLACRTAHVGRGTFYYWKARFNKDGYAGLEEFASRAPKKPYRASAETEQKVIDLRRAHPNWGKKRIADELAKGNSWVPLVSPHTVRRILKDADLWENVETSVEKKEDETEWSNCRRTGAHGQH
jgi:transposase